MPKDVPTRDRDHRERGTFARRNEDPTVASYLSSLFFVLSVPALIGLAYLGHRLGLYSYGAIVLAFGGLLLAALALAFAAMHVLSGGR